MLAFTVLSLLRRSGSCATVRPYSTASTSARQLASMMFVLAPTVLQRRVPRCESTSTRVVAPVPFVPSRMRTL